MRTSPALHGLPNAALERLAKRLVLRRIDALTPPDRDADDHDGALRVVVHGRARWSSRHGRVQSGTMLPQPGTLLGLDSLRDWAGRSHFDMPAPSLHVDWRPLGPLWVLELAPAHFGEVFERADDPLLRQLLRHHAEQIDTQARAAALRRAEGLAGGPHRAAQQPAQAPPRSACATMTMVLVDASTRRRARVQLDAVVDELAAATRLLGDAPWVLHVVWDSQGPHSTGDAPPSHLFVPRDTADVAAFVRAALREFVARWGIAFDHVLIECSAIDPGAELTTALWWAMAELDCTSRVHFVFDLPSQWSELPSTLGLLPAGVEAQPVALLEPPPELARVRTLLDELLGILQASRSTRALRNWWIEALAGDRFARWLVRWTEVVAQIHGSARVPPAWPLEAVRLRFGETEHEGYARWARALTHRRVGLALGGAGAQSYVALPFIAGLLDAGVPIDILSGTSTGAFAAAFHAALGERGLERMREGASAIGCGVLIAYVTNIPLTWWLAASTHFVDLGQLEHPVIAVTTRATTGEARYLSSGLAGKCMMASGAQTPFASTHVGNDRLIDGALTDDLPAAILRVAGAELVVAMQAVGKVRPLRSVPEHLPLPPLFKQAVTLLPWLRLVDTMRGYFMIVRQAAHGAEHEADVFYEATTRRGSAASWWSSRRIADDAADSTALADAIARAQAQWRALAAPLPGRVRVDLERGEVVLGAGLELGLEPAPGGARRLTRDTEYVLAHVGRFAQQAGCTLEVGVDEPWNDEHARLVAAASGLTPARIDFVAARGPGMSLRLVLARAD